MKNGKQRKPSPILRAAEQLFFDPKHQWCELSNSEFWSFVSQKSKRKIPNLPVEKSSEA
ncbi:MAG: hypothetical protein LBR85_09770 [Oscillospiraceae bacterium]|nr:hypothetical protein [Oscillospiraceae bacterium]